MKKLCRVIAMVMVFLTFASFCGCSQNVNLLENATQQSDFISTQLKKEVNENAIVDIKKEEQIKPVLTEHVAEDTTGESESEPESEDSEIEVVEEEDESPSDNDDIEGSSSLNNSESESMSDVADLEEIVAPETGTTYKKVDEYVYVTASSLNVRSGAGTSYKKVGSLSKGAKVHRIGVGTNGWSKIEYKGSTRYVSSNYLSAKKTSSSSNKSSTSSTYKNVDKYMYVTASSLNVRSGPGTSYKKVATLSKNTKVHVIAEGKNGWNKIDYKGSTRYVSSSYLSSQKASTSNSVLAEMNRRGNIGRLKISSVGVNVALFKVSAYDAKKNQAVVDRKDSAAYMTDARDFFGFDLIGDHRHQGFDKMKNSVPGKTTAVIDFGTRKETYICTEKFKGRNKGDIVDMKGNSIAGRNNGGLTMYTCNTDGTITVTFWKKK